MISSLSEILFIERSIASLFSPTLCRIVRHPVNDAHPVGTHIDNFSNSQENIDRCLERRPLERGLYKLGDLCGLLENGTEDFERARLHRLRGGSLCLGDSARYSGSVVRGSGVVCTITH